MRKHPFVLSLSCLVFFVAACAEDDQIQRQCEPCPDGFSCRSTAFGTLDCLPDRNNNRLDGGAFGQDSTTDAMPITVDANQLSDMSIADRGPELDQAKPHLTTDQGQHSGLDALVDQGMVDEPDVMDTLPTLLSAGSDPGSRIVRLDVPTSTSNARLSGCQVIGRNAGSGLSGVFAILQTNITDQLQTDARGNIPLVLLSRFLDWPVGQTAAEYGAGVLEFYLGYEVAAQTFAINEASYQEGSMPLASMIRFDTEFSGASFQTSSGAFTLDTASFSLPFRVELDSAWLNGRVAVTEEGVSMVQTTLNGYLSFSSVRGIVMAIQTFCNQARNDTFCAAANRFLDGDPSTPELDGDTSQIARDIILPLMRNLDVHLDGGQAVECDPFCDDGLCVECNAVSVCAIIESVPVEIR